MTGIHDPGKIRTRNPSRRAAADLRFTLSGHWDWFFLVRTGKCKADMFLIGDYGVFKDLHIQINLQYG
jgi:hypothetical protein